MTFYLVHDAEHRALSLLWLERETRRAFAYVPNWDKFVFDRPLSIDLAWDREMRYEEVSAARAARIVDQGQVGRVDDGHDSNQLPRYPKDTPTRDVDDLLGQAPIGRPRGRAGHAAAKAAEVDQVAPGHWVTYRTFDIADRVKANVCATDLRTGRIRTFANRDIEVATFESIDGQHLHVRIRHPQDQQVKDHVNDQQDGDDQHRQVQP